MEGLEILKDIIYGRVDPHIYAFETNTVPSYLKVGDTYRPVEVRLNEWRQWNNQRYKDLKNYNDESAKVGDNVYFRDYSVHRFLTEKGFEQIDHSKFPDDSMEFFQNAHWSDVEDAIADIKKSFEDEDGRYSFYSKEQLRHESKEEEHYERTESWEPRANQQKVINNFIKAVKIDHRKNLLMYAVMRFGKSFTALCCAEAVKAKLVVVVCGKTDVKDEWQQNVEKPLKFKDYTFVTADNMRKAPGCLSNILSSGGRAVVFLSLQDLLGDDIKAKHEDLFKLNDEGKLDILIVDETHYAARSSQTGKVLQDAGDYDGDKEESIDNLKESTKYFKPSIATLHLSGTPYRILLGGEFDEKDIIATVQYSDIIAEKNAWDATYLSEDDKDHNKNEWDNPYYGFPQMVRFAFNLNESARRKLEELSNSGVVYKLNYLFSPVSNKKTDKDHRTFKYEQEVLDLLRAIDGSKEDGNIFSFLNYNRIQQGQMCHHIVMVLPYKGSCDAMKLLIENNRFFHLNDYKVLNISGFDAPKRYTSGDYVKNIKEDISRCEKEEKKTITLTVGRMLTGSTVREWDTMIYLRDTTSPQAYDQAVFRLQSQYIKTFEDKNGDVIKRDMKPQTLLVDFDPTRMFVLENQKALISNINRDIRGNENLNENLDRELKVSPIIWLNANKLQKVVPVNIFNAVREYSKDRSILDETFDVDVDPTLFNDPTLKEVLERQPEMDKNGGVFQTRSIDSGDDNGDDVSLADDNGKNNTPEPKMQTAEKLSQEDEAKSLSKRLQTYYFKLMLFAYLSDKNETSIADIIDNIEDDSDCRRIGRNLELDIEDLKLIRDNLNPRILSQLENKIFNTDELGNDPDVKPESALRKFGKISKSEIVTPQNIASEMIDNLPSDVTADSRFLDIAAKEGEFAYAIYKKYGEKVKNNIYSIPTSGVTYECTRKIYSLLGLPIDHVITDFTSYQMINPKNEEKIIRRLQGMKFDVVVGNPPYQEDNKGNGNGSDPIYHLFIDAGKKITVQGTLIHPARFLFNAGKTPKGWNQQFLNDNHVKIVSYWADSNKVFPNTVTITGGLAVSYWNGKEYSVPIRFFSAYQELRNIYLKVRNNNFLSFSELVGPRELYRLTDSLYKEHPELLGKQSKGHKYSLGANIFDVFPQVFFEKKPCDNNEYAKIRGRKQGKRSFMWLKTTYISHPANFTKYKVLISKADGAAGVIGKPIPARILGKIEILNPNTAYTDTFIGIGQFDTLEEAEACKKYIMTRFARTMLGTIKVTQDNSKSLWLNVPLQDFTLSSDIDWSQSVSDIDKQLYTKYGLDASEIAFIERTIKPME